MTWFAGHALGLLLLGTAVRLTGWCLCLPLPVAWPLRSLAAWSLGLAYWVVALFGLAAAGFLHAAGLAAATLPVAVLLAARRRDWHVPTPPSPRTALAALPVVAFLVLAFARTVSPAVFWDDAVYHLTLPRLYVEHGGFRPVEMNVYAQWPLATEMLFAAAMIVGSYVLAKAVHFGFGLLTVATLFTACRSAGRGWWPGAAAGLLVLASPLVAFEMRLAYVDLAHAFFLLAAFVFLDAAFLDAAFLDAATDDDGADRSCLLLAGVCCGLAAGVKLNGILALPVLLLAFLPRLRRLPPGEAVPSAARVAVPAVLLWLPWLIKSAAATGNPVYPLLHGLFGGPDWSPELGEHLGAWHREIGMGRGALDHVLLPLRLFLLGEAGDYGTFDGDLGAYWLAVVPVAVAGAWGRYRRRTRPALATAGLFFVAWAMTSQQARLLIPILPLLALAAALAVAGWAEDLAPPRRHSAATQAAAVVLAVAAALAVHTWSPSLAGGWRNLRAFARLPPGVTAGELAATVVPPHLRFINENLPDDARVLFLNTNQAFFCRREVLADSFFEASQIAWLLRDAATPEDVRRRLAERGVTHVLLDRRPRPRRLQLPDALGRLLADPRFAQPLYRSDDGRFAVLRLIVSPE